MKNTKLIVVLLLFIATIFTTKVDAQEQVYDHNWSDKVKGGELKVLLIYSESAEYAFLEKTVFQVVSGEYSFLADFYLIDTDTNQIDEILGRNFTKPYYTFWLNGEPIDNNYGVLTRAELQKLVRKNSE